MARPEKIAKVEELQELFKSANGYFLTDYQGLNVADVTVLRKNLRENNVRFLVAKNTLLKRAIAAAGKEDLDQYFNGPTAVAFAQDDPAVAAKIIYDSYKEKELPRVKAFVVDEQVFDGEAVKRLADLPPRDVLLSQLVAAIESPLTALVSGIDAVFQELIGTVDALADKKKVEA